MRLNDVCEYMGITVIRISCVGFLIVIGVFRLLML
jgi:hypothetical protein